MYRDVVNMGTATAFDVDQDMGAISISQLQMMPRYVGVVDDYVIVVVSADVQYGLVQFDLVGFSND